MLRFSEYFIYVAKKKFDHFQHFLKKTP
jgi:hypothetical protein